MSAFFMYYEEVEWSCRIHQAGFRIAVVPQAKLWHKILPDERGETVFWNLSGFSKSINIYKSLRIWKFHLAASSFI